MQVALGGGGGVEGDGGGGAEEGVEGVGEGADDGVAGGHVLDETEELPGGFVEDFELEEGSVGGAADDWVGPGWCGGLGWFGW